MITNEQAIELAFKGFKTIYTDAYTAAPAYWDKVAMSVPSGAREETYGRLGIYKPMFAEMGHLAKQHPDELLFGLLDSGFTSLCYDGLPFFDAAHPAADASGAAVMVSNMQAGTERAWYLLDTSRAIKPLI